MQNVVLTIHLILALLLTGAVLLQRSEGGGLGMGGGGSGVMTGRQTANIMTRLTWIFGIGLFVTSIALTVIAARESANSSIIDQFGGNAPVTQEGPATNLPGLPAYTPPPTTSGQPVTPPAPAAEAPAATEPAATEPAATEPAATAPAATEPAAEPAADAPAAAAPAVEAPAAETPAEPAAPATN